VSIGAQGEEMDETDHALLAVPSVLLPQAALVNRSSRPTRLLRTALDSLWFIPVICVLGGMLLSLATITIDRAADFGIIPEWLTGGPDAALAVLTTIAFSMVSLATLVLTITMVVVQLAMGQFSPRIVRTFLRDKPSQLAIGLFVATFAHATLAMREVRFEGDGQVPGLALAVSYVLVLTSITMLVLYVHHIGRSLRVSALLELVGNETRSLLEDQYPEPLESAERDDPDVILAPKSGVLIAIDRNRLMKLAAEADCVLHIVPALGGFVPAGAPLIRIEGPSEHLDRDGAAAALTSGLERTLEEDVAYGFRMLVDMAERALSESPFLDPTTAVQAIDRLHDGLRQLATRVIPDGRHYDDARRLRITLPVMDWDAYVHLSFDEIRLAGIASPQVSRRLLAALRDLLEVAPQGRRGALQEQLELVEAGVRHLGRADSDETAALTSDSQGIGVRAGVADRGWDVDVAVGSRGTTN
jgi:uncharacterized membrane protein